MQLSELIPDRKNARKRTKRGSAVIEHSLRELGAGRSIVIDKHGRIIAGNGVFENAEKAGISDVQVIESDGTKIIAVKRTDLDLETDAKAKQLAIADNRTAELAEWQPENLAELSAELDLKPFFTPNELSIQLAGDAPANDANAEWVGMPEYSSNNLGGVRQLIVHFKTDADVLEFAELIGQQFSPKAKFIWHPKEQNADMASLKYTDAE